MDNNEKEKERSVSRESNDDARKLSASEGSIVDKESSKSPASSESGTLKKPKKFRPRKFIAKRFKMKKSDEQEQKAAESEQSEQESSKKPSMASKISEKLTSPKLQRFNFVKRFSGSKSYKVSPSLDSRDEGKQNLKTLGSLSVSESSVKKSQTELDALSVSTDIVSFEEREHLSTFDDLKTSGYASTSSKETVTLESKKVELKITMSAKKTDKRGISPSAIDTASQPTQLTNEPSPHRTDIVLPTTSTHVRLTTARDYFFNPVSKEEKTEQKIKPIIDDQTFAAVVKEGLSVKAAPSGDSKEVEKYLVLTSSLNTIISAAKELDGLSSTSQTKDPIFEELRIYETEIDKNPGKETIEDIIGIEEPKKEILASSTPISGDGNKSAEEFVDDSDEMKKQSVDKDSPTTVHTQEAHKPYHVSLSSSSSEEFKITKNHLNAAEIKFEVGTPVRPQRTSPASSTLTLDSNTKNLDESFHSIESEKSFQSETTRRRIAYVPQLTIYTPEEQELLKSNLMANASDSLETDSSMFPVFDSSAVRKIVRAVLIYVFNFTHAFVVKMKLLNDY